MDFWNGRRKPSLSKGIAAGAIGGLVASWTMNQFQSLLSKASEAVDSRQSRKSNGKAREGEDATVRTAEIVTEKVAGRRLRKSEKAKAGPIVHYGFGTLVGALYGGAAEYLPQIKSAWGLPYGTAVFIGADEVALPALGLSKLPTEYPFSTHANALASHLVYGATVEMLRRVIREKL